MRSSGSKSAGVFNIECRLPLSTTVWINTFSWKCPQSIKGTTTRLTKLARAPDLSFSRMPGVPISQSPYKINTQHNYVLYSHEANSRENPLLFSCSLSHVLDVAQNITHHILIHTKCITKYHTSVSVSFSHRAGITKFRLHTSVDESRVTKFYIYALCVHSSPKEMRH